MDEQQYEHQSECQDYVDYCPQGYHPVVLGEKFNHTYVVVQKLGWGHFSTVWLVQNQNTKEYAALKIQRKSAIDEMKILNEIRRHEKDPKWIEELTQLEKLHPDDIHSKLCRPLLLYDNFAHHGIHGKHYCSVFEILGPNLLDLIQHYQFKDERMPLWLVKKITIDVLLGLVYLHEHCNIIHTDLKPENIMIKMEPDEQAQFIENIKKYKVKPISMKFLKNLQASKNSKAKKKNEKKKLKKKLKKEGEKGQAQENEEQPQKNSESAIAEKQQQSEDKQVKAEEKFEDIKKIEQQSKIKENSDMNDERKEEGEKGEKQEGKQPEVDMKILKWKNVKIELNKKLFFKIVDMGNACFANHHYTQDIQTRQYRSPEVILGYSYEHNTDVWSLACTVFEMLTNTFLFKPKPLPGIKKDEDHLYKIIEVLGPISKQYALGGQHSNQFFNKKGKLLNGHPKEHVRLNQLLHEDFGYSLQDSVEIQQFLLPMLEIEDSKRVSARQCLKNEWLWK